MSNGQDREMTEADKVKFNETVVRQIFESGKKHGLGDVEMSQARFVTAECPSRSGVFGTLQEQSYEELLSQIDSEEPGTVLRCVSLDFHKDPRKVAQGFRNLSARFAGKHSAVLMFLESDIKDRGPELQDWLETFYSAGGLVGMPFENTEPALPGTVIFDAAHVIKHAVRLVSTKKQAERVWASWHSSPDDAVTAQTFGGVPWCVNVDPSKEDPMEAASSAIHLRSLGGTGIVLSFFDDRQEGCSCGFLHPGGLPPTQAQHEWLVAFVAAGGLSGTEHETECNHQPATFGRTLLMDLLLRGPGSTRASFAETDQGKNLCHVHGQAQELQFRPVALSHLASGSEALLPKDVYSNVGVDAVIDAARTFGEVHGTSPLDFNSEAEQLRSFWLKLTPKTVETDSMGVRQTQDTLTPMGILGLCDVLTAWRKRASPSEMDNVPLTHLEMLHLVKERIPEGSFEEACAGFVEEHRTYVPGSSGKPIEFFKEMRDKMLAKHKA